MPMMTQDHYQMVTSRSGEQIGMNRNMAHRAPETSESPGKSAEQRPGDFNQEYLNATPNERQTHILNHGQHITSDSAPRRHSVFAGKESENLGQSSQQAMGSYMLQNRAMGSSGMNIGPSPGNPVSNNLFPPQMRNNLQHHFGTNSHVSNNMPSVSEVCSYYISMTAVLDIFLFILFCIITNSCDILIHEAIPLFVENDDGTGTTSISTWSP
jgi:hypothetical protein